VFYVLDFFVRSKPITGFTTTIVTVLFLGGVQLVSIGILGEYIGRIYEEIKQRPLYIVQETVGFSPPGHKPGPANAGVSRDPLAPALPERERV
jgi:polyisoprenyl-phosphate glycosyltransferase